jgi:hypothetical protein
VTHEPLFAAVDQVPFILAVWRYAWRCSTW